MIKSSNQTHLFSLYVSDFIQESWKLNSSVIIQDADLIHRMVKVLRFTVGDRLILFNKALHADVVLEQISKKSITIQIKLLQKHQELEPLVSFFLPLLKKEALEQAVYSLCELGMNQIQLVVTQKSRQQLMGSKEFQRLENIVIAAAEQSKHYAVSQLLLPISFEKMLQDAVVKQCNILFDPTGQSFFTLHEKIASKSIGLLVGPEAGLTDQELQMAKQHDFYFCALTPTILTAVQAVALGAGLMRLK